MEFDFCAVKTPFDGESSLEEERRLTPAEKFSLIWKAHAYIRKVHDEKFLRLNPRLHPVDAKVNWMRVTGVTPLVPMAELAFRTTDEPILVPIPESDR